MSIPPQRLQVDACRTYLVEVQLTDISRCLIERRGVHSLASYRASMFLYLGDVSGDSQNAVGLLCFLPSHRLSPSNADGASPMDRGGICKSVSQSAHRLDLTAQSISLSIFRQAWVDLLKERARGSVIDRPSSTISAARRATIDTLTRAGRGF